MYFNIDIAGINVYFRIKGYETSRKENWFDQWCSCDFSLQSGDWLNYHKEDDQVLLCSEVEVLESSLADLLSDKLDDVKEIECIEPDFVFKLYPKRDLRKDPSYTYIQPGHEISDIYMEWQVYFWCEGGLTENYLTVTFSRDEIVIFREYLRKVVALSKEQENG